MTRGHSIEAGQRLIKNDQLRIVNQRTGKGHLLTHAFRKSLTTLVEMWLKPERRQKIVR